MPEVHEPQEAWIIRHGSTLWLMTPADALNKLAELAYDGALPGTYAELWCLTETGWQRYEQPWEGS